MQTAVILHGTDIPGPPQVTSPLGLTPIPCTTRATNAYGVDTCTASG